MPMFVDFPPNKFAAAGHISGSRPERPDATVCYHLLLYRDLIDSPCGEGVTFRPKRRPPPDYRARADAVPKLTWWYAMEANNVPILSYDNLLRRLWKSGVIRPYQQGSDEHVLALAVPHEHWLRLGFQETDPSTDFRSGGLLGLACLVYVCEKREDVRRRFTAEDGDVGGILPLAGTSINVTNMIADILMLKQSVESVDALLRPRKFWGVFLDPMALLVLHGLCLDFLADVVVEIRTERKKEMEAKEKEGEEGFEDEEDEYPTHGGKVSAFDFPLILERTKRRIEEDLLGAGPTSIKELQAIAQELRTSYKTS